MTLERRRSHRTNDEKSPIKEALNNAGYAFIDSGSVISFEQNTFGETVVVSRPLPEAKPNTYFIGPTMIDDSLE